MIAIIQPSGIKGSVQAAASKSSMQRACAAALLSHGETLIKNPGHSSDDKAAIGVIKGLGAQVETLEDGSIRVVSGGVRPLQEQLDCGESGLGIRMFAPIMALASQEIVVTGHGSLLSRPMDFFDSVFPTLGVAVVSNGGKLPLKIRGPLQPRSIEIDGSLSSQFLTGLLMAYAAAGARDVAIKVRNLTSKPYIDLTLDVMARFGWKVENRNYEEFYFGSDTVGQRSGIVGQRSDMVGQRPGVIDYQVEGDWSGAAFLLVAAAIAGYMRISGLNIHSTQADKAILGALKDCGADLVTGEEAIEIGVPGSKGNAGAMPGAGGLRAFVFDATDCPDLFPPLVALAACCQGETVIEGVSRLAHKESDRGLALQQEFGKLGIAIQLQGNRMLIRGGEIRAAVVDSHNDHRIAMACAVAGLRSKGAISIQRAMAINKSYPDFYTDLQKLGVNLEVEEGSLRDARLPK